MPRGNATIDPRMLSVLFGITITDMEVKYDAHGNKQLVLEVEADDITEYGAALFINAHRVLNEDGTSGTLYSLGYEPL